MDKIIWKVAAAPTGRYRSFEHRGWPHAHWPGEVPCARICCEDDYTAPRARGERPHAELVISVAIANPGPGNWDWRRLKARAKSLTEAKQLVERFWTANYNLRYIRKTDSTDPNKDVPKL